MFGFCARRRQRRFNRINPRKIRRRDGTRRRTGAENRKISKYGGNRPKVSRKLCNDHRRHQRGRDKKIYGSAKMTRKQLLGHRRRRGYLF